MHSLTTIIDEGNRNKKNNQNYNEAKDEEKIDSVMVNPVATHLRNTGSNLVQCNLTDNQECTRKTQHDRQHNRQARCRKQHRKPISLFNRPVTSIEGAH